MKSIIAQNHERRIFAMGSSTDWLGFVIKNARLKNGMTRKEFAAKLKISPRHLQAIENEKQKPSFDLLFRLIRLLSVSPDLVFYPEKHKK
jgi:DNA-binding XRE family transcriptional regulator